MSGIIRSYRDEAVFRVLTWNQRRSQTNDRKAESWQMPEASIDMRGSRYFTFQMITGIFETILSKVRADSQEILWEIRNQFVPLACLQQKSDICLSFWYSSPKAEELLQVIRPELTSISRLLDPSTSLRRIGNLNRWDWHWVHVLFSPSPTNSQSISVCAPCLSSAEVRHMLVY